MLILRAWFLTLPTSCPLGFETTFRDVPLGQISPMPHAPVAWPQGHCVFPLGCWEDEMKSRISTHTNAAWRLVPREHPTARRPSPVSNPHKAQSGAVRGSLACARDKLTLPDPLSADSKPRRPVASVPTLPAVASMFSVALYPPLWATSPSCLRL